MANSKANDRRFKFALQINEVPFMKGDPDSIGVLFFNLNGRNFDGKSKAEYDGWLDYMGKEYETTIKLGDKVVMLDPDGVVLDTTAIGAAFVDKPTAAMGA